MESENGNTPPLYVLASAAEIYSSTDDPATLSPRPTFPSPTKSLLSPGAKETSVMMVMKPLTLAQPPLNLSVTTSRGSATKLSGRTGLSIHALRHQKDRDDLVYLLLGMVKF